MIKLENIEKVIDKKIVLSHINLSFKKNEDFLIIGNNRFSKDILFKILCLDEKPDAGVFKFNGNEIDYYNHNVLNKIKNDIYFFDINDSIHEDLSVEEYIIYKSGKVNSLLNFFTFNYSTDKPGNNKKIFKDDIFDIMLLFHAAHILNSRVIDLSLSEIIKVKMAIAYLSRVNFVYIKSTDKFNLLSSIRTIKECASIIRKRKDLCIVVFSDFFINIGTYFDKIYAIKENMIDFDGKYPVIMDAFKMKIRDLKDYLPQF